MYADVKIFDQYESMLCYSNMAYTVQLYVRMYVHTLHTHVPSHVCTTVLMSTYVLIFSAVYILHVYMYVCRVIK